MIYFQAFHEELEQAQQDKRRKEEEKEKRKEKRGNPFMLGTLR